MARVQSRRRRHLCVGSVAVSRSCYDNSPGGGGTPHMKGVGMLVGNFELNPKRRPIWAGPKLFLTLKRDRVKTQTIYRYLYF